MLTLLQRDADVTPPLAHRHPRDQSHQHGGEADGQPGEQIACLHQDFVDRRDVDSLPVGIWHALRRQEIVDLRIDAVAGGDDGDGDAHADGDSHRHAQRAAWAVGDVALNAPQVETKGRRAGALHGRLECGSMRNIWWLHEQHGSWMWCYLTLRYGGRFSPKMIGQTKRPVKIMTIIKIANVNSRIGICFSERRNSAEIIETMTRGKLSPFMIAQPGRLVIIAITKLAIHKNKIERKSLSANKNNS